MRGSAIAPANLGPDHHPQSHGDEPAIAVPRIIRNLSVGTGERQTHSEPTPMTSQQWLRTEAFADVAGISRQAARKVLRASLGGQIWRGQSLKVRRVLGRGGRGGLAYEVCSESLPFAVAASGFPNDDGHELRRRAAKHDTRTLKRIEIIEPARSTHGPARARGVLLAAAASDLSPRTIYRWLKLYEEHGIRGLAPKRPSNAGQRRVVVSRPFDRAWREAGYDEARLALVGSEIEKALKGLWASRAEGAGSTEIRRMAEFLLLEICEARAASLPREAFRLSRCYVERFAVYRVVNQRRNDRKAFDDARPRIRRDWTSLAPMERIIADVKHLDVIVTRDDGTPAWPKIVAFMDAGTGRVFVHPVLLEQGEGVRQEHVVEAFLAMVADPAWGFPQGLYLDNGSEFGALVKIDGAMQLLNEPSVRTLIYARPYNASAKPIESVFARLDRYVFALLPGYAGPDRMAKKTQTVGRPPKPYPGSWNTFFDTVRDLITTYNLRPVGGLWAGRCPDEWYREKLGDGWRPTVADPCALDAAFADADSRRVDRGVLKIKGKRYTHERLSALPSRTTVDLALPWRRNAPPLAKLSGVWTYLREDVAYPARWIEGAREAGRRQVRQSQHISALAREAPPVDPVAVKLRMAKRQVGAHPAPSGERLDLGAEVLERAKAARLRPPAVAEPSPSEQQRARERALTERLERVQKRCG